MTFRGIVSFGASLIGMALIVTTTACGSDQSATLVNDDWQLQLSSDSADTSFGLAAAPNGDVIVTGATEGSLGGEHNGKRDVYVGRFAPDGTSIWAQQFGGPANDSPLGVSVSPSGQIYLSGFTDGDFGGPNAGSADVWIAQLDTDGNMVWLRQFGGDQWDRGFDVTAFADGAYVSGYTSSVLDDATDRGEFDAFVARFDASGNLEWVHQFGSDATDWGQGSALAPDSGLYLTGYTEGDFGGPNQGDKDAFVLRISPTGETLWVKQFGSSGLDWTQGVGVGADGQVVVAGTTDGSVAATPAGDRDILIVSFDADGNELFATQLGTPEVDYAFEVRMLADKIVATGSTAGDLGEAVGGRDAIMIWLDTTGDLLVVDQFGSAEDDDSTGLDVFEDGSTFFSGYTFGQTNGAEGIDGSGSDILIGGFADE